MTYSLTRRKLLENAGRAGVAVSVVGLAACGGEEPSGGQPQRGGVLAFAMGDMGPTDRLDPSIPINTHDIVSQHMLFDPLVTVDLNFQPEPALAEAWESSSDGQTWEFQLRRGVEFHDGKPLTSEDVVWTLQRVADPKGEATMLALFQSFLAPQGVTSVGRDRVRFSLKRPNFFLPQLLAGWYGPLISQAENTDFKQPAGTGAFKFESFDPGTRFEASRNPSYWRADRPYLDGVTITAAPEQSTKVQDVISGDADLADMIEPKLYSQVEESEQADLVSGRGGVIPVFVWQGQVKPYDDPLVREALKLVMDRQRIVDSVYFGHADVSADILIPPTDPFYPTDLEPLPHDPEKARSLLAKAGQSDLTFAIHTSEFVPGISELPVVYKELAAEAGITVNVSVSEPQTYLSTVYLQRPSFMDVWVRTHTMALPPLVYTPGSVFNETQTTDPRIADLFAEAQASNDEQEQRQKVADAAELMVKTSQAIPCAQELVWARKQKVQGLEVSWPSFVNLQDAYIAE